MQQILFLTEHSPFKTISGAHQRTNLICTAFSKFANVDVLPIEQDKECNIENCIKIDMDTKRFFYKPCLFLLFIPPIFIKFYNLTKKITINILGSKNYHLAKTVKKLRKTKKYDFVFVRYIKNLRLFGIKPDKSIIIDIDDLPEHIYHSKLNFSLNDNSFKSFIYKIYYSNCVKICRFYTKKIVNSVAVAYLPYKEQCSMYKNTVYLPNIPYLFKNAETNEKTEHQIMFVGMIEYEPNYKGLEYFLDNIYPLIINEIPDVVFNIAGNISQERKIQWLNKYKNILIHGFVDDLKSEYQKCSLIIVPVYTGAGTNIKVIEAMSIGKACVISSFAARGFEDILTDGENILIADNDIDFSVKVIELLKNREYRENIGRAAKETVNSKSLYSFDCFKETIKKSIQIPLK